MPQKLSICCCLLFFLCWAAALARPAQIAGEYAVHAVIDASECGEGVKEEELVLTIAQTGERVIVTWPGVKLTGTVKGNVVQVKGSYEENGTVTKNITLKISGGQLTGSEVWTYTTADGTFTCKGTGKF